MNPYASPKPCNPERKKPAAQGPQPETSRIWTLVVFTTVGVALAQFAWALGLCVWNVASDNAEAPAEAIQLTSLVCMLAGGVTGVVFALRLKRRRPTE